MAHELRENVERLRAEMKSLDAAAELAGQAYFAAELGTQEESDAEEASDAADAAVEDCSIRLEAAEHALTGSDCPREWTVRDEHGPFWTGEAVSAEQAFELADPSTDMADFGSDASRYVYSVRAECSETGESESFTVVATSLASREAESAADEVDEIYGSVGCSEAREASGWLLRGLRLLQRDPSEGLLSDVRNYGRLTEVLRDCQTLWRALPHGSEFRAIRLYLRLATIEYADERRIVEGVVRVLGSDRSIG